MAKTATCKNDPIFVAYARTAPLEDLRFFLRGIRKHIAVYEMTEQTMSVVREMVGLESELADQLIRTGSTANAMKRVCALHASYKSSIAGYAGAAGFEASWVDDLPAWSWTYACQGTRVVTITIQPPPEDPTMPPLGLKPEHVSVVMPRYDGNPWEKRAAHRLAEEQNARDKRAADALHHFKVPMRIRALDDDAVSAMLGSAQTTAQTTTAVDGLGIDVSIVKTTLKARPKPAAKVQAPGCPSCRATLVVVDAATWTCPPCQKTWQMVMATPETKKDPKKTSAPRAPRPEIVRTPRVPVSVDANGRRECVVCSTSQAIDQFTWGDGGRTIRKMCRTCRRTQQQAARQKTQAA